MVDLLDRIFQPLVGDFAEQTFKTMSKIHLPDRDFKMMTNVILRHSGDKMTQIDQILFSKEGIFVIEIKGYKGWIFGREDQKFWTQSLTRQKRYQFYNPIWQNNTHIKALVENTGLEWQKFVPIILFSGEVQIKSKLPPYVLKGLNYIDYIQTCTKPILTDEDIGKALAEINKNRLSQEEHEAYLSKVSKDYKPKMTKKEFMQHAKKEILKDIWKEILR